LWCTRFRIAPWMPGLIWVRDRVVSTAGDVMVDRSFRAE
jgi:hypothetical protein